MDYLTLLKMHLKSLTFDGREQEQHAENDFKAGWQARDEEVAELQAKIASLTKRVDFLKEYI